MYLYGKTEHINPAGIITMGLACLSCLDLTEIMETFIN
jgi:hypothetical protein